MVYDKRVDDAKTVAKYLESFQETFRNFVLTCSNEIQIMSVEIAKCFQRGNKILIFGNGGSASDSLHLAAEFSSSFTSGLSRPSLPAFSLSENIATLTAYSNDFGFEGVFSRQIQGLGKPGDIALAISTSGRSENCLRGINMAASMGLITCALTSESSNLYKISDFAIGIPKSTTQHIQECHVITLHLIATLVEKRYLGEDLHS